MRQPPRNWNPPSPYRIETVDSLSDQIERLNRLADHRGLTARERLAVLGRVDILMDERAELICELARRTA